jgi:hypothetical protein
MKTYKVTRIETIKEEVIVKAKNEEDAINMFEEKKMKIQLFYQQTLMLRRRNEY